MICDLLCLASLAEYNVLWACHVVMLEDVSVSFLSVIKQLSLFLFFFLVFLGPRLRPMEVPRLGVESEL